MSRNFALPGRSPVLAENGVASTSHPLATTAALTILKAGGNAVDAAIAAVAVQCVVEPHSTGIGGDCFAIVSTADGTISALNASGRSPARAELGWFRENGIRAISPDSPHAATVPGALKGWETLHQRHGRLDFERLLADAIAYAINGFAVHPRVARDWAILSPRISAHEGGRRHYMRDGRVPTAGERFSTPALGGVLQQVARQGSRAFYEGAVAAEIAATVQALGGLLEEADLAAVSADWVEPIETQFCGHKVLEIPPNGQGLTALVMMNLLSQAGFASDARSAERYHLSIETARIAYAIRDAHIADPAHMKATVSEILSAPYTDALLKQYRPDRRNDGIVLPRLPSSDTVYLCVADRDGMMVSLINSTYHGFGSCIVTPQTGIALQSRGSGFVLEEGHPNAIAPRKRPMHTIIPGMAMKDGLPSVAFGVMGGAYQPLGHAQVMTDLLHYGMDPQQAVDGPRLFWDADGTIEVEDGIADEVVTGLQARGHRVRRGGLFGGGQMIVADRRSGFFIAGSDPRKDGQAAGY